MTALGNATRGLGVADDLAQRHAGRPALIGPDGASLDYATLAAQVRECAGALRRAGVQRGDRVAIWTAKDVRYVVAILATLHAGAAYVPLDGAQPAARVASVLADAEPTVLVTDRERSHALAAESGNALSHLRIVLTDDTNGDGETWQRFVAGAPPAERVEIDPDDLAALLYTSGSTGTPKGVQITHRNLLAFVEWGRTELDIDETDVFANHASFNFDLSTFDLFVALGVGAAVWIVPGEQARDVAALARGLRAHRVSVLYCVPSVLRLLTASGVLTPEVTASLRYVLFAGEHFPTPQLRDLAATLPTRVALFNLYGPTETNVCTAHRVTAADLASDAPIPIGRPLPAARLDVLDDDGRPVAGDALGELMVAGDCVTPGYWRRPEESAAAGHPRGRHATGDLVSRRADGALVYRGRKDRMVKLSGYRIELGEVEAVAARHPQLAEVAVVVAGDGAHEWLTLYFSVRDGEHAPSMLDLKRHCARRLPPYMVPRIAVRLAALPRNANGKTDYRCLASGPGAQR